LSVELPTPSGVISLHTEYIRHNDSAGRTSAEISVSFAPRPDVSRTEQQSRLSVVGLQAVNEHGCALQSARAKGDTTDDSTKQLRLFSAADLYREPLATLLGGTSSNLGALLDTKLHPAVLDRHVFVLATDLDSNAQTVGITAEYACTVNTDASISKSVTAMESNKDYPPLPPTHYAGSWKKDNTSRGDWIGKYGKEGYVLFGFDNGTDVTSLPAFVTSIKKRGDTVFVGKEGAANASYLEDPRASDTAAKPRALGFVTAGADGSQGTVLDVKVDAAMLAGAEYQIALYMVGAVKPPSKPTWSATKQAIRVMVRVL
jgi:hypothetical protein